MSKLIVLDPQGDVFTEKQLDRERIKIGRRNDSDLILDNISVSGEHALITTIRNDSFIQDLGSTNGVRVNGKLVKNHHLQDGDEINVGTFNIKFQFEPWVISEESWLKTETRALRTMARDSDHESDATLLEANSSSSSLSRNITSNRMFDNVVVKKTAQEENALENRLGVLRLMGGTGDGKQLVLDKPVLTLGKPGIQTAVIGKKSAGYYLTYVEGANYPLVNGVEVGATPYPLQDHDILELAGTRLEFFYR